MARRANNPDVIYRRRWLSLSVLCVSLLVIVLDNTILNVALPRLSQDLHASTSALQWIVDIYVLVFAGLLLTAGSLGDRFGRYKALVFGMVIFGLGSLASALSGSASALIATRAFMGIGGAFIMPATLSIITNVFTDPIERGRAIGIWAGVSALGAGIGPLAGGFLLTHFYWGSVFFVNVPIIIAGLIAGWFLIPDSRDPTAPKLDPVGALLSIVGLATVLWAIIEAPSHGWTSTPIVLAFLVGVAVIAGFVLWELHTPSPMLNMAFFKNPRFTAASLAITLTFLAMFGSLFIMTQYLQAVLGYTPLQAGAVLLPQAVLVMIVAPLSSKRVIRYGNKLVVAVGMAFVCLGLLGYGLFQVDSPVWLVILMTMTIGMGMGNVLAPATDSIMGSLPREKAGVGSAMNDTTRQTGGAIGVAVLGSVLASRFTAGLSSAASLAHVPHDVAAQARQGITDAVVAAQSPAAAHYRTALIAVAKQSFMNGFHLAAFIAAGIIFFAALGVLRWLPARPAAEVVTVIPDAPAEPAAAPTAVAPALAPVFDD
ncbi:MAG TPA: DHA2 family efflux MFS transporter permease subunit [Acidimicrobiales bacterium]|nr:DHA2 family efflux MFS transporter permease subunit [Acidimicrobiales bacterium]